MTPEQKRIDPERYAVAQRLRRDGTLTDGAVLVWCLAELGFTHRDIAVMRKRSKGTVTEQLTRARRLVEQEVARCRASEV